LAIIPIAISIAVSITVLITEYLPESDRLKLLQKQADQDVQEQGEEPVGSCRRRAEIVNGLAGATALHRGSVRRGLQRCKDFQM
jgi:hypothetical protein